MEATQTGGLVITLVRDRTLHPFSARFSIAYNTNTVPAAFWSPKDVAGAGCGILCKNGHWQLSDDGQSTVLGTVINTNYMGTNYPVSFQLKDLNSTPTGSYLLNYANQVVFVAGTNSGTVEVYALTLNPNPCLATNFYFDLKSCQCSTCSGSESLNNSVDLRFSLGPTKDGSSSFLEVESETPDPRLGSPQSLHYNFSHSDVQVITNSQGWLRQVVALDRVADIITNSADSYLINFYHYSDIFGFPATNGLYFFTNSPYESFLIKLGDRDVNHVEEIDSLAFTPVDYYWQSNGWKLVTGGLRAETKLAFSNGSTTYTNAKIIADTQGNNIYQSSEVWQKLPYGPRLLMRTIGTGSMMMSEQNVYTTNGMLQQAIHSDGSWDIYVYDSLDRQVGHYSAFTNSTPTTNSSLCRYTATTYDDSMMPGSGDDLNIDIAMPRTVVDYVLGSEVSRRYYLMQLGVRSERQCVSSGATWNDPSNLVTTTYYFTDAMQFGQPSQIVRPDGTIQLFENDSGVACPINSNALTYSKKTVWTGTPRYVVDTGSQSYWDWTQPAPTITVVVDGTMDETWTDSLQRDVLHRVTDVASQAVIEQEKYYYDSFGHLTNTIYLNRTSAQQRLLAALSK